MAVYFDYVVTSGGGSSPSSSSSPTQRQNQAVAPSWTRDLSAEPLLAVGLRNKLQAFSQEGEFVQDLVGARKSSVSCSDWHPTRREAVAGWQDGCVTFAKPSSSSASSSTVVTVGQDAHQGGIY